MDDDVDREPFDALDRESEESSERWIAKLGLEGDAAEGWRNRNRHWILVDDELVSVGMYEWAMWFEVTERRIIARSEVMSPGGRIFTVSTVFLGIDHGFSVSGPPILFETMIFDWELRKSQRWSHYQRRYASASAARVGHMKAMEAVEKGVDDEDDA